MATVQTDFIIQGPPGVVEVSLNMRLKGTVGGGTVTGGSSRTISMGVDLGGSRFSGYINEAADANGIDLTTGGNLVLPPGACASPCSIETPTVFVATNMLIPLGMSIASSVIGFSDSYGRAHAFDSLTFPVGEDVFTLPPGYTAVIYGMNVENNRVVGPDDPGVIVPEPAVCIPVAGGLLLLAASRRRKRGVPPAAATAPSL